MTAWRCRICGYTYDERVGEAKAGTPAGTRFADLPEDWRCPVCRAGKDAFVQVPEADPHQSATTTVGEVIIDQLASAGVRYVFGIPGTSSLGLVDAVRKKEGIEYIIVRHEANGAMAAAAYGKLTGLPAVCLTIGGPGATNLATGLYDAKEDHAPLIALNGQVEHQYTGPGGFQEIDQDAFFRPIAVYNTTIHDRSKTVPIMTAAIKNALLQRGVAQVSVPNNIQKQPLDATFCSGPGCLVDQQVMPGADELQRAVTAIDRAVRPVIIAGFGAYRDGEAVEELARRLKAPILTTFRAKGILPEGTGQVIGILGNVGSPDARVLANGADLLITLGVGFSSMTSVPLDRPIVQVDRDPLKLGKNSATIPLLGDCAPVIRKLTLLVGERKETGQTEEMQVMQQRWIDQLDAEAVQKSPIPGSTIMKVLSGVVPPEAVISVDVGENCWWFGRNFQSRGQVFVMSGYLATMGAGFPGAIAARLAYPDRPVVCITGDGGFVMAMGDLVTAVKYRLPMVIVVMNNRQYGMIQVEQMMENYENFGTELVNPDFAAYAEACGAVGVRVERPEDLGPAVTAGLASGEVVVIDVATDPGRF
jgi:pyruvate oxidase